MTQGRGKFGCPAKELGFMFEPSAGVVFIAASEPTFFVIVYTCELDCE